ncbi:MAG: signal peptidase I [Firmicutes bacterium]|nr:signal peptidase I [Bacillota bacterium]
MLKKTGKIILQVLPYLFFAMAIALILQIVVSIKNERTPTVFGYGMFLVVSPSMEDTIMTGDLIFVDTNETEYFKDDIITFHQPGDESVYITHRIKSITVIDGVTYITTKGDNNQESLDWEINFDSSLVIGKYLSKSTFLGDIYYFVFSGGMNFLYAIAVLIFLMIAFTESLNIIKTLSQQKKQIFLEEKEKMIQDALEKLKSEKKNDQE